VSSAVVFTLGAVIPLIAIHDTAHRARNPPTASLTPSDGTGRASHPVAVVAPCLLIAHDLTSHRASKGRLRRRYAIGIRQPLTRPPSAQDGQYEEAGGREVTERIGDLSANHASVSVSPQCHNYPEHSRTDEYRTARTRDVTDRPNTPETAPNLPPQQTLVGMAYARSDDSPASRAADNYAATDERLQVVIVACAWQCGAMDWWGSGTRTGPHAIAQPSRPAGDRPFANPSKYLLSCEYISQAELGVKWSQVQILSSRQKNPF
jgi:hypothetical protein